MKSTIVQPIQGGHYHAVMALDPTEAHILFQRAFADVAEQLTHSFFQLRGRNEPPLALSDFSRVRLEHRIEYLRKELVEFEQRGPSVRGCVSAIRDACNQMDTLRAWMHDHVFSPSDTSGYKEKTDEATTIVVLLRTYTAQLLEVINNEDKSRESQKFSA